VLSIFARKSRHVRTSIPRAAPRWLIAWSSCVSNARKRSTTATASIRGGVIKRFSRKKQAGPSAEGERAPHPFGYDLLIAWSWTIARQSREILKVAKIDLFQSTNNGTSLFYNLDASVGKGGTNRRDDVLLVQYLLKISAFVPGKFRATVGGATPVAGVWGEPDDLLLDMVQRHWAERGTATFQDQRVDPVPQNKTQTPIHHAQYKILTFNAIYQSLRPADFPKMAEATDCPADLKAKIKAPAWLGT
jgi:hypothetical protein